MDRHIHEFYRQTSSGGASGAFHEVISLNSSPDITWEEIYGKVPQLPRGWFELNNLSSKDRIEFVCDYWGSKLSYRPTLHERLDCFFSSLDDIDVFITQKKWGDPFNIEMIYSLSEDSGFYRGGLPASEEDILKLKTQFDTFLLPQDYLSFLQIHNGWWKTTDCTGMVPSSHMHALYSKFQGIFSQDEEVTTSRRIPLNPKKLIPFYESFGMPYYQCFWDEWYPEEEMGNVYYCGATKTISQPTPDVPPSETMAFPTFSDWLIFYLERVE